MKQRKWVGDNAKLNIKIYHMIKNIINKFLTIKNLILILVIILMPFVYFYSMSVYTKIKKDNQNEIKLKAEKVILDSLSKVKEYNLRNIEQIGFRNIVLKTKFDNGVPLFIFSVDLADEYGIKFKSINPYPNSINYTDYLKFTFFDKDGFELASEKIFISQILHRKDDNGNFIGLSYNGDIGTIDKEVYMKISSCDLSWSF